MAGTASSEPRREGSWLPRDQVRFAVRKGVFQAPAGRQIRVSVIVLFFGRSGKKWVTQIRARFFCWMALASKVQHDRDISLKGQVFVVAHDF